MGTPHIGMGRDMSIFQIGESPYRYGVHSNLGTNMYIHKRQLKSQDDDIMPIIIRESIFDFTS